MPKLKKEQEENENTLLDLINIQEQEENEKELEKSENFIETQKPKKEKKSKKDKTSNVQTKEKKSKTTLEKKQKETKKVAKEEKRINSDKKVKTDDVNLKLHEVELEKIVEMEKYSQSVLENIEKMKKEMVENAEKEQGILKDWDKDKFYNIENNLFKKSSLANIPVYPKIVNGILFIGDPHLWSKNPGRRLDNYTDVILNKLKEAIEYANKHNLLIVCLGDLFEKPEDNDIEFLTKVIEVVKNNKMLINVGNHDIHEHRLTFKNPLKMLEKTGLIELTEDNGFAYQVDINNKKNEINRIIIGATPYGHKIPDNVLPLLFDSNDENIKKKLSTYNLNKELDENVIYQPLTEEQIENIQEQEKGNRVVGNVPIYLKQDFNHDYQKIFEDFKKENEIKEVIWLTHHDLAMTGAYPNSIALKEIYGVDRVINGHIHGTKMPVKINNTVYYNVGNIARMKIDMIFHKPAVWQYDFDETEENALTPSVNGLMVKELKPYYLTYQDGKEVFKLNGKHEEILKNIINEDDLNVSAEVLNEEDAIQKQEEKIFASLLLEKETEKTDDGSLLSESLRNFLEEKQIDEELKEMMSLLFNKAINSQ